MSIKPMFQSSTMSEPYLVEPSPVFQGVTAIDDKCRDTYTVQLKKGEDGWIIATVPELKGVVTQGKTEDEAEKNAAEATELMLEELGRNTEFTLVIKRVY
jgi:predicted RNase H-like HicB family nuclease